MAAEAHIRKLISDLVSALHVVVLCGAHNMLLGSFQEKVVEDEVKVEPKYHRHFIQRRGQVRL